MEEIKTQGVCGRNCFWISCATIGGLFMGTGNFLYASNYAKYGLVGVTILGPSSFISGMIIKISREVYFRHKHGYWFRKKDSTWI